MSNAYIVFERISVHDANCIAGFTYGFPAITHFLGFGHALSRKLTVSQSVTLQGCAVICHQHQIHAYQPKGFGDYVFAQSKNPPTTRAKAKETPPIIEEGKMDMTVSLVMACPDLKVSRTAEINALAQTIKNLAYQHRLAGGSIHHIEAIHVLNMDQQKLSKKLKRLLLPGFVLMDRSDLLASHYQNLKQEKSDVELMDAWLDFSALKYQAKPKLKENELEPTDTTEAEWLRMDKPAKGWLVPITNGYKAISQVYPAGDVANTRDFTTPVCFVEAAHSIGEWRSLHRIQQVSDMLWHYRHDQDWYLCHQGKQAEPEPATNELEEVADDDFEDDFLSSLN
ncbi:type I-F CRISPR-associated protein Csy2 [Methylicorpusculum oleiharenae]|uniref:type I-F CRISPR-associated protein Csy2 n=1 Tax=Methylicorpusculum oleiharenae TaxID=1338687 RepID=UPI00135C7F7F|nr:type I-F CRISPR-associated protein Csy2 [Methylicorpusculum oleiharenae]MCD2453227.1 type I-F CRISPR-associated protein Csy2 [Methylicorpusculum oleiharenae]